MTAEELRQAAIALFGERGWMSRLAEALGVDRSTVSRWFAGLPIPGPVAAAMTAWTRLHDLTGETPMADARQQGRSHIMYIEDEGQRGPARIGRVYVSKTGQRLTYRGQTFQALKGVSNANCFDIETGERFWISPTHEQGLDRHGNARPVEIDDDVAEEYWRDIRGGQPPR